MPLPGTFCIAPATGAASVSLTNEVFMSSLFSDLCRHAGQLTLAVLFMALLSMVLYGETTAGDHARVLFNSLFSTAPR